MLLALNVGFYNTKVKTNTCKGIHETKVRVSTEGDKTLKIGKVLYEIGEGTRNISDKTKNDVSTICSKYNILKYGDNNTQLAVALPMNLFLNKTYRKAYENTLTGAHVGIVDGIQKIVNVTKCICYAEGAAAYLDYKSVFKDQLIGIVDIGGNTINIMIYNHGKIIKDTISTLDLGMIKLEREIRDTLNIHKGWNVQSYEVKDIIKNNECKDITERIVKEHIDKLKNELLEKKWNIERLTLFFTGGGSTTLKSQLESNFNGIIVSEKGLYDNVDGLYKVLLNANGCD